MVFLEMCLILKIRHWYALKLHPIHCIQRLSFFVSTVWTWLWPFFIWFRKTMDTFYLPRCGLENLTLHLSSGAQPAPLPDRALSPFPLLGPRRVTREEAQGPGPLLQSHSGSPCFVDSAPLFIQHWRRNQAVLWSSGAWREQSDILPTSQELTRPACPPLHTRGDLRNSRLGFSQHSVPSWVAKQITLCSQISEWKNWKLNSLWTLVCGGGLVVFLSFISAKHVCFWFFDFLG